MRRIVIILAALILSSAIGAHAQAPNTISTVAGGETNPSVAHKAISVPLFFEANQGQTDSRVRFLTRSSGYTLFMTPTETVLAETSTRMGGSKGAFGAPSDLKSVPAGALRMQLIGANRAPTMKGNEELPGKLNYLIGNDPTAWHTGVPLFSKVQTNHVYPGVDLVFHGNERALEYDFVVAPGADPNQVAFRIRGAKRIEIDSHGDLVLHTAASEFRMHKPVIYQADGTSRRAVDGGFILRARNEVRFQLGAYDRTQELVIDPAIGFASFLGGAGVDIGGGFVVDDSTPGSPKLYLSGETTDSTTFPEPNTVIGSGTSTTPPVAEVGFVAKIDPTATGAASLIYLTFIGGKVPFQAADNGCFSAVIWMALDKTQGAGGVQPVLGAQTSCSDYPTTTVINPVTAPSQSDFAVVATRLTASGGAVDKSALIGGNDQVTGSFVSVGIGGEVLIAGATAATNLPVKNPYVSTLNNGNAGFADCFVAKLERSDLAATYLTYMNTGRGSTRLNASGCGAFDDSTGNILAGGNTPSGNSFTFGGVNLANGFEPTFPANATEATWAVKLNPSLSGTNQLMFATYFAGGGKTAAANGAFDLGNGVVAIVGRTNSNTAVGDIPLKNPFQMQNKAAASNGQTGYLLLLDTSQTGAASLLCSTYFGGSSGNDIVGGVGYDAGDPTNFRILLSGQTSSADFPVLNEIQPYVGASGSPDGFVSVLNVPLPSQAFAANLVFSTYIGGSNPPAQVNTVPPTIIEDDRITGVGVDGNHTIYAIGSTNSPQGFFTNTNPATTVKGFQAACASCSGSTVFDDVVIFSIKTGGSATLDSIAVTPTAAAIATGQTQQFHAVGNYSDGTEQDITNTVTWSTVPSGIAMMSGATPGLATGSAAGVTQVTPTLGATPVVNTGTLTVTGAGPATHFLVSAPPSVTAGTAFNFTVTAQDAANNTATGYMGTVHFTSTDGAASLPADMKLTNGVGNPSVTLNTVGSQTIKATDTVMGSIAGTSNTITVSAGAPETVNVNLVDNGSGAVGTVVDNSVPQQINCTTATGQGQVGKCSTTYPHGTTVTFTATPAPGAAFANWSGSNVQCQAGTPANVCTVTVTGFTSIFANFTNGPGGPFTLSVSAPAGATGGGRVTSGISGGSLNCAFVGITTSGTCTSIPLKSGTISETIPVADPNSNFAGYAGTCANQVGNNCFVTMSQIQIVTPVFNIIPITLNVAFVGNGTVTSDVGSINCSNPAVAGNVCRTTVNSGTVVTLTEAPGTGFSFATPSGWSPAFCGINSTPTTCILTLNAGNEPSGTLTMTATFTINSYLLNASTTGGNGSGTVTSNQNNLGGTINCGPNNQPPNGCGLEELFNATVILTATPSAGSTFTGWAASGVNGFVLPCSNSSPCTFSMPVTPAGGLTVTANFTAAVQQFALTVTDAGTGAGTVMSQAGLAPAINCTTGSAIGCSANYNSGTPVTLTATPATGSTFAGWSGGTPACSGTSTCAVTMTQAQNVTATFTATVQQFALTVTDAGTGSGTVKSQQGLVPAISCTTGTADGCTGSYNSGTVVTLTATAGNNSAFAGWSGGTPACNGTTTCTVTMTQAQNVTATFNTAATLQSITISPATPAIPQGQVLQLFAIGMFSDGSQQDLTTSATWASDTPGAATVSNAAGSQGQVTGVAGGTATISAKSGGIIGNTLVTVAPLPTMVPSQLFFTEATLGTQTPAQTTTFTNPGPGALQISGITLTGSFPADFGQTSDCGTVSGPGACPINTTFTPHAQGPRTADVSVASNSPFSPTVAHLSGNGTIRQLPGFATNALPANDDNSTGAVPLPFAINYFGTAFNSLFVNNNGNVTFGQALGTFTPTGLNGNNGGIPIMAPFWADVDTTGLGSSIVTYGNDTVNGHQAFGVNYQNVGYFASNFDKLNSFQLVLIDRLDTGAGNFDMEFNYDKIQWEVGDASGGTGGLCGALVPPACVPAAVGYSNGTGNPGTNFQLAGSFVAGALLDGGPAATSLIANDLNNSTLGRYLFSVRNGVVQADTLTLNLAGTGTGTVKDNTGQLTCSDFDGGARTCNANYPSGTQLVLTATADTGSAFTGWSAPCSGTGICALTITQNTTVTATFTPTNVTLQSITVAPPAPSIVSGSMQPFTATGHFSDGSSGPAAVTWSSANKGIATIDAASGVATGVTAGGPVTITATSTQNQAIFGTAQLTVTAPVVLVSIAVTPPDLTIVVGQQQQYTATGTFSDNSKQDITSSVVWASSNTEAATITGGGLATGLTGGEQTTISASKVQGGSNIVGSTTLTVTTVPFVLTITPPPGGNPGAPPTITPGGTLAIGLTLTATKGFNGTVTFSCVSDQPQFLTCTPAPSSVTLSGNTPKQVAIVMNTFCKGETPMYGPGPGGFGGGLALLLAAAMLGNIAWAYRTRPQWALSFALLMLIALGGAACGGPPSGPSGRTPAGPYVLTITASVSGGASQTVHVPIQVTP